MEIVPSRDIDIEKVFADTIADLHEKFGPEVLKINTADIIKASQMQHCRCLLGLVTSSPINLLNPSPSIR